jgi:hypothetical protein
MAWIALTLKWNEMHLLGQAPWLGPCPLSQGIHEGTEIQRMIVWVRLCFVRAPLTQNVYGDGSEYLMMAPNRSENLCPECIREYFSDCVRPNRDSEEIFLICSEEIVRKIFLKDVF